MRRWAGPFAFAVASTAAFAGCDLGLQPFVEPTDAASVPPSPTIEAGSDGSKPLDDDARAPDDAGTKDAGEAGDASGPKRVFITSTLTTGNVGGLAGADARCQAAAAALGGTFVAWLSVTGTPALARLKDVGPWFLVDGKTRVFATRAVIATTGPEVPIDRDEKNLPVQDTVWTGTLSNGTAAPQNCGNFLNATIQANGMTGISKEKAAQWTQSQNGVCAQQLHLYCFEQ